MARRFIQQAGGELQEVYSPAKGRIKAGLTDTNDLYASLIEGLGLQGQDATANILDSAERRGVGRDTLAEDVGLAIGDTVGLEEDRLRAGRAGDIAAQKMAFGDLGVGRAGAVTDLAGVRQDESLAARENKLNMNIMNAEQALKLQEAERGFELAKLRAAREAAERAAEVTDATTGAGGGGPNPPQEFLQYLAGKGDPRAYGRAKMDKYVNQWFKKKGIKKPSQRQAYWDLRNRYYGINPKTGRG